MECNGLPNLYSQYSTMATDDLVAPGARASAPIALTKFDRNISVLTPEGFKKRY